MTKQQLIQVFYSGEIDQSFQYMNLMIQATSVLVGGIVLWKMSTIFHNKKLNKRSSNNFFGAEFSKKLKSKD
jgi:hypothetical protein